ncbi:MAG: hypothetical protein ACOY0T_33015 [Myxococcota bacterium]
MTWLRKITGALGVTMLGLLAAPGCADNESMLFVEGVLAVEATDCVAKAESGALMRAGGTLDLALRNGYRAALLVGSQLTQRGSRERLRTETARLQLEGADITLQDAYAQDLNLGNSPNPFSTIGSGFVNPSTGTDPGLGVIFVDIIPAALSAAIEGAVQGSGLVLAKVKVFGTTLGGQKVESGEYQFPIQICRGCLINYPTSTNTGAVGSFSCVAPTQATTSSVCLLGQDQVVPCTECAGFNGVCSDPCNNCAVRSNPANAGLCTNTPPAGCSQ